MIEVRQTKEPPGTPGAPMDKATTVTDWPDLDDETMAKVRKKINTGWNIHLKE